MIGRHLIEVLWLLPVCLGASLIFASCDTSTTLDPGGSGGPSGGGSRQVLGDPSLSIVVQGIFDRNGCNVAGCHSRPPPAKADLDLRTGFSYLHLVDVQATTEPQRILVIPGNAKDSYLILKLEGRQTVGDRMPPGRAPLDSIDMANLRNWIDRGARNN